MFSSVYGMILNLLGDSFLFSVIFVSKSDKSASDEKEGDGDGDLFLFFSFFLDFVFLTSLAVYYCSFVRTFRFYQSKLS